MVYVIIVLLLFLIFFLLFQKRKEKEQEKRDLMEFFIKAERLMAEFNQAALRNIDMLEEKIKEVKGVIKECDERIKRIESKRFPEVFRLKEEGFEITQIAKMMNRGKGEIELILKQ